MTAPSNAERWEEVARIFGLVMDVTDAERASILDRECAEDDELRREVEELLAEDVVTASDVAGMVAEAVHQLVTQEVGDTETSAIEDAGLSPGDLVDGRYTITRVLGTGGMGVVVAAEHRGLDEPVAIKLLRPGALATERARRRFLREAKAAARIRSPHVVKVRDVGTLPGGSPYMVMDLLEGADLAAVLRARGAFPSTEACLVTLQACEALAVAHARGVIHRDIKPGNLFLERAAHGELNLKLLDFGISKVTGAEADGEGVLTRTSDMVGSPAYMSPEQLRSSRDVDARSDLWSLGVVLYEMLAGRRPFIADNVADLSMRILAEPPPPLEGSRPGALERIVLRCLEKDRDARYADVGELARALGPLAGANGTRIARRVTATLAASPADAGQDDAHDDETWALADTVASGPSDAPPARDASRARGEEDEGEENEGLAAAPPSGSKAVWGLAAAVVVGAGVIGVSLASADREAASTSEAAATASFDEAPSAPTASVPPRTEAEPVTSASASASLAPTPTSPPRVTPGPRAPAPEPSVDPYGSRQ